MLLDLIQLQQKYNLNIKGVLHIGAHLGQEFETYKKLNINNIIFFEPLPTTFKKLKERIGERAVLVNSALGNIEGEVDMFVETANGGASSSVLEPSLHLKQYPHIKFVDKVSVPISKLDNYIEHKDSYNFINIDVQGYELEVLKGGSEFLKSIDYIMTEVNRDELYKDCVRIEELDGYLLIYGFERVETTWAGKTWGDALYIKNKVN